MIRQNFISAYVLSPHRTYAERVSIETARIADLWFYATPAGKERVVGIDELVAELIRNGPHSRESFTTQSVDNTAGMLSGEISLSDDLQQERRNEKW